MHNDAQIAKENARAELAKLEQSLFEAKKERDAKLEKYKKQAEEKKEHAEKVEKRVCSNDIWCLLNNCTLLLVFHIVLCFMLLSFYSTFCVLFISATKSINSPR